MPRNTQRAGGDRSDLYQDITDKIIAELEAGRMPWVQPWANARAPLDMPHNASTRSRYSGINIVILWDAVISCGFSTNAFLTFRQALSLGGHVRQGERGTTVVYAKPFTPAEERRRAEREGREAARILMLKRFTVFNTDQCDDLPAEVCASPSPIPDDFILPAADALIKATGADFRIGGDQAFYAPGLDFVQVPRPDAYFEPVNWHRTAFHELGHWSGHGSRLNRDLSGTFGSVPYGREELVAEMAGAFVCASMGIEPTVRHADYIGSWLAIIREDNRAIVRAASAASKAADFILGFRTEAGAGALEAEADLAESVLERRAA
jgi:antirestriction protein ArdC